MRHNHIISGNKRDQFRLESPSSTYSLGKTCNNKLNHSKNFFWNQISHEIGIITSKIKQLSHKQFRSLKHEHSSKSVKKCFSKDHQTVKCSRQKGECLRKERNKFKREHRIETEASTQASAMNSIFLHRSKKWEGEVKMKDFKALQKQNKELSQRNKRLEKQLFFSNLEKKEMKKIIEKYQGDCAKAKRYESNNFQDRNTSSMIAMGMMQPNVNTEKKEEFYIPASLLEESNLIQQNDAHTELEKISLLKQSQRQKGSLAFMKKQLDFLLEKNNREANWARKKEIRKEMKELASEIKKMKKL